MRQHAIMLLFYSMALYLVWAEEGTAISAIGSDAANITFIIISQPGQFHSEIAETSRRSLLDQWKTMVPSIKMKPPKILLTSEMDPEIAEFAWTIFPLVHAMMITMGDHTTDWIALLNENTEIDLKNLKRLVLKNSFKPREESLFFGRGLEDSMSTIVHHFSDSKMLYPDLEAGIFLSRKLVLDLWRPLRDTEGNENFPSSFNIDPAYEFAKFLKMEMGVALQNIPHMCTKKIPGCVTFTRDEYFCLKDDTASMKDILSKTLVAVKTCTKFHENRIRAVLNTWAPLVTNLMLISDTVAEVGTEGKMKTQTNVLEYTINTKSGHCNKTFAILHNFIIMDQYQFLVIVDDDTILSVARLVQMLACYIEEDSFLLGGGGMILNRDAVVKLLAPPEPASCITPDTADDMHLGMWATRKQVPILHSGRMFQARPPDYPESIFMSRVPVSFHKHWNISPNKVYNEYFRESDKVLVGIKDEL